MATKRSEDENASKIATAIAGWAIDKLVHPPNAASFDFESYRELIAGIQSFYSDVAIANLSYTPEGVVAGVVQRATGVLEAFKRIENFDFRDGDPNQNSRSVITNLQNQWREAYTFTVPHLSLAKVSSAMIAQEVASLRATLTTVQNDWKKASEEYSSRVVAADSQLKGRIEELEKVLVAAREASAREAVSAQASEFEAEAGRCLEASARWFKATIGAVALSLIVVWLMFIKGFHGTQDEASVAEARGLTAAVLQQTVARILVVTLLYSAVVWCARNYFACRHN